MRRLRLSLDLLNLSHLGFLWLALDRLNPLLLLLLDSHGGLNCLNWLLGQLGLDLGLIDKWFGRRWHQFLRCFGLLLGKGVSEWSNRGLNRLVGEEHLSFFYKAWIKVETVAEGAKFLFDVGFNHHLLLFLGTRFDFRFLFFNRHWLIQYRLILTLDVLFEARDQMVLADLGG